MHRLKSVLINNMDKLRIKGTEIILQKDEAKLVNCKSWKLGCIQRNNINWP